MWLHTGGCTDTVRESALKDNTGRKIPCRTGDSNLRQYCAWLLSRTLYPLSYPRTDTTSMIFCRCTQVIVWRRPRFVVRWPCAQFSSKSCMARSEKPICVPPCLPEASPTYAFRPVPQKFPQRCLLNSSNIRLTDDGPVSSFQGRSSSTSSSPPLPLPPSPSPCTSKSKLTELDFGLLSTSFHI